MKNVVLVITILFIQISAFAADVLPPNDIIFQTKFDNNWSEIGLKKIRTFLKNNNFYDPFEDTLVEPIIIDEPIFSENISPELKQFATGLGNILNIDLINARIGVTIHKLKYKLSRITSDMAPIANSSLDSISTRFDVSLNDIMVEAEKVDISIRLPDNSNPMAIIPETKSLIDMSIHRPRLSSSGLVPYRFNFSLKLFEKETPHFGMTIINSSFDPLNELLSDVMPTPLNYTYESLVFPKIQIVIGDRVFTVEKSKIESYMDKNKKAIESLLMEETVKIMKAGTGHSILKVLNKKNIPKNFWIPSKIPSYFSIEKFKFNSDGHFATTINGSFCSEKEYAEKAEGCLEMQPANTPIRNLTTLNKINSQSLINELINQNKANLVFSIGENYITRLIRKTIDIGLWDETLKGQPVVFGPQKSFVVFDKKGPDATLVMDIIYKLKCWQQVCLGDESVRIPIVAKVNFSIELREEKIPYFIVFLKSIDTSEATLMRGLSQFQVPSSIQDQPRFKKMVIKKIQSVLGKYSNKEVLAYPLPEVKNLSFEKAAFFSDGNGRATMALKLEKAKLSPLPMPQLSNEDEDETSSESP